MVELSEKMVLVVIDKDGNEHKITFAQLREYLGGGWVAEDFPHIKEADCSARC